MLRIGVIPINALKETKMTFQELLNQLENKIQKTYESGVSLEEAEKLAAEFLHAQLKVSAELKSVDLDSRTKKSGLKAVRAAAYMTAAATGDKKPTEAAISAMVDTNKMVSAEQDGLDMAEVNRADLERYYDIFLNAHIYFRGVAKGSFGG